MKSSHHITHSSTAFLDTVRFALERYRMFKPGDRVLVAVSGGPDSLALLASLTSLRGSYKLSLRAAYVDHGLRPAAARREAALVRKVGRLWGVPVSMARRAVRKEGGRSLEEIAREARYEALIGLARRGGCRVIALGHTRDDQAETVLLWLLRGTGTTGLAGIPPVRTQSIAGGRSIRIVRPLIACSRKETEGYVAGFGLRPSLDRSNRSPRYLRNRIRHHLIPLLERQYSPQLKRRLSSLAQILREDREWMDLELKKRFQEAARLRQGGLRLDRTRLKRFPPAVRKGLLRLGVQKLRGSLSGFHQWHWETLEAMLTGQNAAVDLPHSLRAEMTGRWVRIKVK